jgi:hypothetical protein
VLGSSATMRSVTEGVYAVVPSAVEEMSGMVACKSGGVSNISIECRDWTRALPFPSERGAGAVKDICAYAFTCDMVEESDAPEQDDRRTVGF